MNKENLSNQFFQLLTTEDDLLPFIQTKASKGFIFIDVTNNNWWVDKIFAKNLGFERATEIEEEHCKTFFSDEEYARFNTAIQTLTQSLIFHFTINLPSGKSLLCTSEIRKFQDKTNDTHYVIIGIRQTKSPQKNNEQTSYLNSILDKAHYLAIKVDLQGNYIYANQYYCERLQVQKEDLLGTSSFIHTIPEDHSKVEEVAQRCFDSPNESQKTLIRKPNPNGGYLINYWDFTLITDDEGEPLEFVCIGYDDILPQIELKQEVAQLQALTANANNGFLVLNPQLEVKWANRSFCTLSGFSPEEIYNPKFIYQFFGKSIEDYTQHALGQKGETKIFKCQDANQHSIWLNLDIFSYFNEVEQQEHYIFICSDVTEIHNKQEKIELQSQILNNITDNLPCAILSYELDAQGNDKLHFLSQRTNELYELDAKEGLKDVNKLWAQIHPDDIAGVIESVQRSAQNMGTWDHEWRLALPSGKIKWVNGIGTPSKLPNGSTLWSTITLDISSRKKAEEELRLSEEQLKLSIEGGQIGLWDWYIKSGEAMFNERWAEILGYTLQELEPTTVNTWIRLCHPADFKKANVELNNHFKGETKELECELRMKHKNGAWIWFLNKGKLVEWTGEGKPARMSGILLNIDARKKAELELNHAKNQLEKLTASVPGMIFQYEVSLDGKNESFKFLSNGIHKFLDRKEIKAIQEDASYIISLVHADDRYLFDYFKHLQPVNIKFRGVNKNGEENWYQIIAAPELEPTIKVTWYGILIDIHDLVVAQQEAQRLAHVAQNSHEMLLTCNREGIITWANEVHTSVLGLPIAEIIGKSPVEVLQVPEHLRKSLIGQIPIFEDQIKSLRPSQRLIPILNVQNETRWIRCTNMPIWSDKGEFLYSIVSRLDVTELVEHQKSLQQLLNTSTDQNNRLKEYSFITSHNVRSSVALISGLTKILLENPSDTECLNMLSQANARLDKTLHNLNELLHLEKDFLNLEKSEYDLAEAVIRVIYTYNEKIERMKADIQLDLPHTLMHSTIPAYFDSIVQNLFMNALKYGITETSRTLKISLQEEDNEVYLKITDFGLGIDLDQHKNRLFKLGNRLHNTAHGDGLGLYMVKQQVEALEGKVGVESEVGKGSTFIVSLP